MVLLVNSTIHQQVFRVCGNSTGLLKSIHLSREAEINQRVYQNLENILVNSTSVCLDELREGNDGVLPISWR